MKILVTGGCGFIGSEFVRKGVEKGYEITVVDLLTYAGDLDRLESVKKRFRFHQANITNKEVMHRILMEEKPDVIVHFAAESHVDRSILDASPFMESNVLGTQVLLEGARTYGAEKFLNITTDEVYGELGEEGRFKENSPLIPNSPYSVSKAAADMLGRAYHRTYNLPVLTIRPSNCYGPWQYPEKLIPVVILKALSNDSIPVYGTGKNIREWLHVSDCVHAVFEIMKKGEAGSVYNIGSSQERENIEVVKTILRRLGKSDDLIQFVKDRPGHDYRYCLSTDKLSSELGWTPKIKFEDGIQTTVGWYLSHSEWVNRKIKEVQDYWKQAYTE